MTFEEKKAWLEQRAAEEFNGLGDEETTFTAELSSQAAVLLLFALQRAYHHTSGESQAIARRLGEKIQSSYLRDGTVLGEFAKKGWEDERMGLTLTEKQRFEIPDAFRSAFPEGL